MYEANNIGYQISCEFISIFFFAFIKQINCIETIIISTFTIFSLITKEEVIKYEMLYTYSDDDDMQQIFIDTILFVFFFAMIN